MMDNVGYHASSNGVISLQAPAKSLESDHIYEELSWETEDAASMREQNCDIKFSNGTNQQSVNKNEGTKDDYSVNNDLFPEENKTKKAAADGQDNGKYYINDDLFPNKHYSTKLLTVATILMKKL